MDFGLTRTLLHELAMDDYVRFKYGKRIEAALKQLDQQAGGADPALVEAKLLELMELVRGKKKGAGASAPAPKSPRAPREKKGKPDEPA